MSAFLMNLEGFSQLASELAARAESAHTICDEQYSVNADVRKFLNLPQGPFDRVEDAFELCRSYCAELYTANVDAVNYRHSHLPEAQHTEPIADRIIRTGYWPQWSNVQLLKHLQCLRYQMSEGDIPETPIYAKLNKLISDIALSIVDNSPEYDKAAWDFGGKAVAA